MFIITFMVVYILKCTMLADFPEPVGLGGGARENFEEGGKISCSNVGDA